MNHIEKQIKILESLLSESHEHPGFKAIQNKVAKEYGGDMKQAGAVVAATSRKAKGNGNKALNKVKGTAKESMDDMMMDEETGKKYNIVAPKSLTDDEVCEQLRKNGIDCAHFDVERSDYGNGEVYHAIEVYNTPMEEDNLKLGNTFSPNI